MTSSIIDSHVHLWNRTRNPQHWIDPDSMSAIDRDFDLIDLKETTNASGAVRYVLVQSSNSSAETDDLLAVASDDSVVAVIGWVDLSSRVAGAQIDDLRERFPNGKLRGIRHLTHLEDDPNWLNRADVSRGLRALSERGLVFELVVRPDQLEIANAVVSRHPDTKFVLDHLGNPPISSNSISEWTRWLSQIATRPNLVAKLSGIVTNADWDSWRPHEVWPVLDLAFEVFGSERLMFGSDWPLVTLAGGYERWLTVFGEWAQKLPIDRIDDIYRTTAMRTYGFA